jgi:hypothetical protein
MTTALEGGEGSASRPDRSLPLGKTRYSLYRRLGGSQGRSGQVRKISPPLVFDPRTAQPVASRYTDYATRPTNDVQVILISDGWFALMSERAVDLVRVVTASACDLCELSSVCIVFHLTFFDPVIVESS